MKLKESPAGFDLSPILNHCETLLKEMNQTIIPNMITTYKESPINKKIQKIGKYNKTILDFKRINI
jgi:hypothetical protein